MMVDMLRGLITCGVPGGHCEGPTHADELHQGGDRPAVKRHWNSRQEETGHPGETSIPLNRNKDKQSLHDLKQLHLRL